MSIGSPDERPGAVRVELFEDAPIASDGTEIPDRLGSSSGRWSVVAMAVGVVGLVAGLWWLASLGTDQASTGGSGELPQTDRLGDLGAAENSEVAVTGAAESWSDFTTDITHVAMSPTGLITAGDRVSGNGPGLVGPELQTTRTGSEWRTLPLSEIASSIASGARVVGLSNDGGTGLLFTTTSSAVEGTTDLVIYSATGLPDVWKERNRVSVDGFVRTVTARAGRWVAIVDDRAQATTSVPPMRTTVLTGLIDDLTFERTSVAPDEFVSSFAATENGFIAIVVRLQLQTLSDDGPTPQLREWTTEGSWEVVEADLSVSPGAAPARIIDAGSSGVFLSFGTDLFTRSRLPPEWVVAASGRAVVGGIKDGNSPETTPALAGEGFMITDTTVGPASRIWLSGTGDLWRQHTLTRDARNLKLLKVVDGVALVAAVSDGVPGVLRIDLNARTGSGPVARAPAVREQRVVDGEWSTPLFSTSLLDGRGFLGLTNSNGQIALLSSFDGFSVESETPTDFPFGYFVNNMETTEAGYHVVGHLGLFEDAVFTSSDGITWDRFEIDLPENGATALQINHFHRTPTSAAMVGSLGWADDLSRTELAAMWWDATGQQQLIPPRPCGEGSDACTITSLLAVEDGVLATHGLDGTVGLSKWTLEEGWELLVELAPVALDSARLFANGGDAAWFLGSQRIVRSDDNGRTWNLGTETPPGEAGRFIAVSSSGLASVFQTETDLWFRYSGLWQRYELGDLEIGRFLAITDRTALFSGLAPSGKVLIRLGSA